MHLRPRRADPQGQSVRPASQIRRRHASRRGGRASRRHAHGPRRGVICLLRCGTAATAKCSGAAFWRAAWSSPARPRQPATGVSFAGKQIRLSIGYLPDRLRLRYLRAAARAPPRQISSRQSRDRSAEPAGRRLAQSRELHLQRRAEATAPRSPLSDAAWRWSRCIGASASQAKFDSTQIRLARQHEQRGVGLLHSPGRAGCEPAARSSPARRCRSARPAPAATSTPSPLRSMRCSAPGSSRSPAIPARRRSCSPSSAASSTASSVIPGASRAPATRTISTTARSRSSCSSALRSTRTCPMFRWSTNS